jgi:hypothetical protein
VNEENNQTSAENVPAQPQVPTHVGVACASVAAGLLAVPLNLFATTALAGWDFSIFILIFVFSLIWTAGLLGSAGVIRELVRSARGGGLKNVSWRNFGLSSFGLLFCAAVVYFVYSHGTDGAGSILFLCFLLQGTLFGALGLILGLLQLRVYRGAPRRVWWALSFSMFGLCVSMTSFIYVLAIRH